VPQHSTVTARRSAVWSCRYLYFSTSKASKVSCKLSTPRSLATARRRAVRQHTSAYVGIRRHTSAYVGIRQHTSAFVSIRQHTSAYVGIRRHTSAYVGIRRHTSAYVGIRQHTSAYVGIRQHTSAYVSIRQHTSAYVSIRRHTLAYVGIRQHTSAHALYLIDALPCGDIGSILLQCILLQCSQQMRLLDISQIYSSASKALLRRY
jgi:hypothetical protein